MVTFPAVTLLPDFFLDGEDPEAIKEQMETTASSGATSSGHADLDKTLKLIQGQVGPDLVKSVNGVFQFDFKGELKVLMYDET